MGALAGGVPPGNGAVSRKLPLNQPKPQIESRRKGENINVEKIVLRNSTGRTALPLSDAFLDVS
jgi:hypothetical protein